MRKLIYILSLVIAAVFFFTSCEDKINPELEYAESIIAVDAFINNQPGEQVIKVMLTQSYFDNTVPPAVSDAAVRVENLTSGKVHTFVQNSTGDYVWTPATADERMGVTGDQFRLVIDAKGETFEAFNQLGRVPPIDSITFKFQEKNAFQPDSYIAEFWATDPLGEGDTYWIRTSKNGVLLNQPGEINLAYDAGFSKAANFDHMQFFPPIRYAINPDEEDDNEETLSPYVPGDSIYVQINSLSESSFNYLTQVVAEADRPGGFAELFAAPLANVSTNINNVDKNGKKAVGFFNVAAVTGLGKKFVLKN